jgi:hypothetical protein
MIAHNTAGYDGGGVYSYVSNPTLTNCTITGNMAGDDGGGVYCSSYRPQLTNCILWADAPQEIYLHSGGVVVTYSDVEGSWSGTGNINADPLFRDPDGPDNDPATTADNDHRLSSNSPCIDADDPSVAPAPGATDLDGNRRLWDGDGDGMTISDMGAYEYGSYRFGDLNCDGYVDFDDINPLTLALLTPDVYATAYPDCSLQIADINGNGVVDYADVNPFVALLAAQ